MSALRPCFVGSPQNQSASKLSPEAAIGPTIWIGAASFSTAKVASGAARCQFTQ